MNMPITAVLYIQQTKFYKCMKNDKKTKETDRFIKIHNTAIESMKSSTWPNHFINSKNWGKSWSLKYLKTFSTVMELNDLY